MIASLDCVEFFLAPPLNSERKNLPRRPVARTQRLQASHVTFLRLSAAPVRTVATASQKKNKKTNKTADATGTLLRLSQIPSFVFQNWTSVKFPSGLGPDKDGLSVIVWRLAQILCSIDLITSAFKTDADGSFSNYVEMQLLKKKKRVCNIVRGVVRHRIGVGFDSFNQ